jgi:hypothetical protein
LDIGICEVLIPLTASASVEVQGNSAAAIGNLSSKGRLIPIVLLPSYRTVRLNEMTVAPRHPFARFLFSADDYSTFNKVWDKPEGGLHGYLVRFLASDDTTFLHIAVWTLVQLLEPGGMSTSPPPTAAPYPAFVCVCLGVA